jgi:hypothetical protein
MTTKMSTAAKQPEFTWLYEYGVLTVQHRGHEVRLGRYATHDLAAKAAAAYFEKHGSGQALSEAG